MEEKAKSRRDRLGGEKAKEIFTIRDTKNGTKLLCQEQREAVYVHVTLLALLRGTGTSVCPSTSAFPSHNHNIIASQSYLFRSPQKLNSISN